MIRSNLDSGNQNQPVYDEFLRECATFSDVARDHFYRWYPEQRPRCRNADARWFARLRGEPMAYSEAEQERLVYTLLADERFRRAVRGALND